MSDRKRIAFHEAGHAVVALELGHRLDKATIVPSEWALGFIEHGLANGQANYEGASGLMEAIKALVGSRTIEEALQGAERVYDADEIRHSVEPVREAIGTVEAVIDSLALSRAVAAKLTELVHESIMMVAMAGQAAECVLEGRDEPDWTQGSIQDHRDILEAIGDLDRLDSLAAEVDGTRESSYSSVAYFGHVWDRTLITVKKKRPLVEAVADALLERETLSGSDVEEVIRRVRLRAGPVGRKRATSERTGPSGTSTPPVG